MNILYTSDTHVHPAHLNRIFRAAVELLPDAVVIGGDINPNWKKGVQASIEAHKSWIRERLLTGLRVFHEQCPHTQVLLDLGNDDIAAARPLLEERDGVDLHLLHMRVVGLDTDLAAVGYMKVNPTPFLIKDNEKADCRDSHGLFEPGVRRSGFVTRSGVEEPYDLDPSDGTIEDDLDQLSEALESRRWRGSSFIFVCHCPPKDTALDRIGGGVNVGSLAVRRFIESWAATGRLLAALHGHIHESPWKSGRVWQNIGGVPCFNIGQKPLFLRALHFDTQAPLDSARLILVDAAGEVLVMEKDEWL